MRSVPDAQLFRDVFNASPIGIVVENLDGQPLFVNPAFCAMLGFSEEELRSKHCVDFSPPEDAEKDWALFQQLRAGAIDHYQLEKRYFRRDGSLVWGRLSISLVNSYPSPLVIAMVEDITEKKTAEEALRASEERFRLAAQAGKMFAYEWDATTDVILRSPGCPQLLGKDASTPTSGRQVFANCHPDDRGSLTAAAGKLSREKPYLEVSFRTLRPDGTVIWVEGNARAYFDERGQVLRIVGMVADVTERRRIEQALRESEEQLRLAVRAGRMYAFEWDARTDLIVRSGECGDILNWMNDPTRDTGREFVTFVHPDDRDAYANPEAVLTPGNPTYQASYRVLRPDGGAVWLEARGRAVFNNEGKILRIIGMVMDVTERKHAEDELRASEEKFRRVFRDAGVGMVIVSPDGRFLAANEAFCECLGYTEEELLQKTVQSITLPEDWPSFSKRLREALERGTSFQRVEKRCLNKSGRIITTESSASLIRGPSGEPQYFVGEVLDVTQRKLADEALSGLSGRLIEAQEEERAWIARELHDDFNQRVALLAFVLEGAKQDFPATEVAARRRIEEACQSVRELATDIQSLSHRLHPSKLEYLGLAAAAAGFCQELSARQNVEIDLHSENIPKAVPKETSLCLFRVLQEALQNAVKHSGVRQFQVLLKAASNEIQLSVHDSGVGFDPDKAMNQHGLGLTSMKERLKLVDGQFSIDSKLQSGTTICARVPLAPKFFSPDPASPLRGPNDRRRNLDRGRSNTSVCEPIRDERKEQRRKNLDRRDLH